MSTAQRLHEALESCLNPHDDVRKQGEAALDALFEQDIASAAIALLQIIESSSNDGVRQLAALLFRRHCFSMVQVNFNFWSECNLETRGAIKAKLLELLSNWSEDNESLKHKVCECVAAVVKAIGMEISDQAEEAGHDITDLMMPCADEYWPELLPTLWAMAQSGNADHLETSLFIFSCIPGVFGTSIEKYAEAIRDLLASSISHDDLKVQVSAALALSGLLGRMETQIARYFADLLPPTIMVVAKALEASQVSAGEKTLKALVELTETQPKLFKAHIVDIIKLMLSLTSNGEMDDGCRRLALEVCVGLCESGGSMMRKVPNFVDNIFPVCLQLIMEVEEDDEWSMQDEPIQNEDENSICGEDALDRISQALGGKQVVPVAFSLLPPLMESGNWRERYAACLAISSIGEGCYKVMRDSLDGILEKCLPLLGDQNMRVQYAAINAIGQMAVDFAPRTPKEYGVSFAGRFHQVVIPAFVECMKQADGHPRVQAHGTFALVNLMDNTKHSDLEPYTEMLMQCISVLLQSQFMLVQEAAVGLLATVADVAQERFKDYYNDFMPFMKNILQHANEKQYRMLRGKTLEAATLMGVSVGKDMFAPDAHELMRIMQASAAQIEEDDPQISYIHTSFARICQVLGDDFYPYLDTVLPPLLRSARLPSGIVELDDEEAVEHLPDGVQAWEVLAIDDQRFAIKTSVVEEKRAAIEMLVLYSQHLGGKFAPLVEDVAEIALKNLAYYFDEGIRISSAILLSFLIHSYNANDEFGAAAALKLFQHMYPKLLAETQREPYPEVLSSKISGIHMCITEMGEAALQPEFLTEVSALVLKLLEDYDERAKERYEQRQQDEDHDEEEEENLSDEEEADFEVLSEVCTLVQVIVHIGGLGTKPFFDSVAPAIMNLLNAGRPTADYRCAVSTFADVVEQFQQEAVPYLQHVSQAFVQHITSEDYELRELAAYVVGLMALHSGPAVAEVCKAAVEPLLAVIQAPGSRESPNTSATENCISAFVKIARNPAHGLSEDEMLTHLLDWLPITEDDDEAKYIYTYLVELLQAQDPRNMQDSPAHGVLGQLMQDPEVHARVQRAVEALGSSA
ncbi:hypothetical protein PTSG_10377 [Salpingoeca rosetta]|uniref:Importin N-terminal domain-containing protein n=1 Tax=Salpingoeca rosetta (strain ATCC 50818 / BSB-021) TaxID=946362 RepID=F2UR49_SALR5|nr:uncharacterized protein PTSG_10377 [Salpingoeca rosetta]EGD80104.1 hypothetical protein PTSG_10377 [Salpingoeca rosetta]|eukprot:XP_004988429.1 hypothetical protein PTSG_10377 [Salpingoeca rosetta]